MVDPSLMKSDRMAKRSTFGGVIRRTLSDVTNSVSQQTKIPNSENTRISPDQFGKEYIDHLVKENKALARLVADKNKIIELTGMELRKMRLDLQKMQINLQKMQLQNMNLAQSNSHMLAELNIGRDKRKVLQHENVCKDVLLKVKNEELKANLKIKNHQKNLSHKREAADEQITHVNVEVQKTRRGAARSKSMGPTTKSQHVTEKEVSENKRRCVSRQSVRFRSEEEEPAEDLFEIEEAQFLPGPSVDSIPANMSLSSSDRKEEEKDENCGLKFDVFQSRRSSLGRPSRRAAEKVQSYKEIPLNIKMRR